MQDVGRGPRTHTNFGTSLQTHGVSFLVPENGKICAYLSYLTSPPHQAT